MPTTPLPALPYDSATVEITFAISPVFQGLSVQLCEVGGSNAGSNISDADSTPGNGGAGGR